MLLKIKNFISNNICNYHSNHSRSSFSLVELSVVISIMAILVASSLTILQTQFKISRDSDNKKRMIAVKNAIENYFLRYNRIPCPGNPSLNIFDAFFGQEMIDFRSKSCMASLLPNYSVRSQSLIGENFPNMYIGWIFGAVPTKVLGLPDEYAFDVYGNHITYIALDGLANYKRDGAKFYNYLNDMHYTALNKDLMSFFFKRQGFNNFMPCTVENSFVVANMSAYKNNTLYPKTPIFGQFFTSCGLRLFSNASSNADNMSDEVSNNDSNNIAYVIINHGENGYGAWNSSGVLNVISPNKEEAGNSYAFYEEGRIATNNVINIFYGQKTSTFDDIVLWSSVSDLIFKSEMEDLWCHIGTYPQYLDKQPFNQVGLTNFQVGKSVNRGTYVTMYYLSDCLPDIDQSCVIDMIASYDSERRPKSTQLTDSQMQTTPSTTYVCDKFGKWRLVYE